MRRVDPQDLIDADITRPEATADGPATLADDPLAAIFNLDLDLNLDNDPGSGTPAPDRGPAKKPTRVSSRLACC